MTIPVRVLSIKITIASATAHSSGYIVFRASRCWTSRGEGGIASARQGCVVINSTMARALIRYTRNIIGGIYCSRAHLKLCLSDLCVRRYTPFFYVPIAKKQAGLAS